MKTSEWGPVTWLFLHVLVEKIIDSKFSSCRNDILTMIAAIINILPCPFCRQWAIDYIKTHPINVCQTKPQLKHYIYQIHNAVNAKLNKPLAEENYLETYKQYKLTSVYYYFINFYTKSRFSKLDYGFTKTLAINNIKQTLVNNTNNFYN